MFDIFREVPSKKGYSIVRISLWLFSLNDYLYSLLDLLDPAPFILELAILDASYGIINLSR